MDTAATSKNAPFPARIIDAVVEAQTLLRSARLTHTPRLEAEMLMAHVMDLERARLIAAYGDSLGRVEYERFRGLVMRRMRGEPIAYIVGVKEFMGHVFRIDRRALIPRPETEVLVEHVLDLTEPGNPRDHVIADIGTGSGCIAISVALGLPEASIHATDISHEALELARENARSQGVADRVAFHAGDACSALPHALKGSLDVMVSNPPYVSDPEYAVLDRGIREFEPALALKGGPDGLDMIRRIIGEAATYLKKDGVLALEIGEKQANDVKFLLARVGGLSAIQVFCDLTGRDRIIIGRKI